MCFRITKYVKNREIHEEDICRIWNFFSSMTQELIDEKTSGVAGLTFKNDAYGEIPGDSDDAIDEAMLRRKPIEDVETEKLSERQGSEIRCEVWPPSLQTGGCCH